MSQLVGRRHWLAWSFLLPLFCVFIAGCALQGSVSTIAVEPRQSPNDERLYRYISLENGLRALLVSDADTEKAAASLDVYVGSAQNPEDRAGLAHFLEHMLFLGTEKYPHPAEYEEFVTEHGGSRNAYTAFEHTNYFFDINQAYLAPALDRFAQFFIAPKFDADYIERETNAVQAEYQLDIKTDARRTLDVLREVANPEHPFSTLAVGTAQTLANNEGRSIRDDLLAFYEQYYSANLMTLVVLGQESPDQLELMVRSMFADVPDRNTEIGDISVPLYVDGSLPGMVYIQPEASQRQLQLSFPLPDYRQNYQRKSLAYIGNLLGHEGKGSLLSLLIANGWAEGLGAGPGLAWRGGSAFSVSIALTEQGLAEREQVLAAVFAYTDMLRLEGPNRKLYEEQAQISRQHFRFRETVEPMRYVSALANDMHYYEPEDVLSGGFDMSHFDATELSDLMENYLTPDNAMVIVIAKDVPVDSESEYYFAPYSVVKVDKSSLRVAGDSSQVNPGFHLPASNGFIADNVELRARLDDQNRVPAQVVDESALSIWFSQDQEYLVPHGAMYVSFRTPYTKALPQVVQTELYASLLRDSVNEMTYPAVLAGLNFSIYRHSRGISLKINGFDDKQLVLLETIVKAIQEAQFDEARFENIKADLILNLQNYKTMRPFSQVVGRGRQLLQHAQWNEEQVIAQLAVTRLHQIDQFAESFWGSVQASVLLNGNYSEQDVAGVQRVLKPLLEGSRPLPLPHMEVVRLEEGSDYVYQVDTGHEDSVVFQYLQFSSNDWHNRALAALSGQVLKSGFFQQLRTEQQLGYVVSAFYWPVLDVPGVGLLVQSPSSSAVAVAAAIQEFLEASLGDDGISKDQFQRHRTSLVGEIMQPHENLTTQSEYYWGEIAKRQEAFDSRQRLAAAVEAVSYEEWRTVAREVMLAQPASVKLVALGKWALTPKGVEVDSVADFQSSQASYQAQ